MESGLLWISRKRALQPRNISCDVAHTVNHRAYFSGFFSAYILFQTIKNKILTTRAQKKFLNNDLIISDNLINKINQKFILLPHICFVADSIIFKMQYALSWSGFKQLSLFCNSKIFCSNSWILVYNVMFFYYILCNSCLVILLKWKQILK